MTMANDLPDYQDSVTIGNGPNPGVSGVPLVSVPGLSGGPVSTGAATALTGLGAELGVVAQKINEGIQHTKATVALSGWLDDNDELTQKYLKDPDYATAEQRYREEAGEKKAARLGEIDDPQMRLRTELQMKRSEISAAGTIRVGAVDKMNDIGRAGLKTFFDNALRSAVTAPSPVAKIAAIDEFGAEVGRNIAAGIIDNKTGVELGRQFKTQLDTAEVMAGIQSDPAGTLARLANPKEFLALDPVTRQSYIASAQDKIENGVIKANVNRAPFDQVGAALNVGRAATPAQAQEVFDKLIRKIENGPNKVDAVSSAGALGLSQIMPATAREMAQKSGMADVAALSDDDLRKRLLSDGELNLKLGKAYWDELSRRYTGNIPAMAAAYNAGPGRADAWVKQATEKFGSNFTAAELASVVDIGETKKYLGKLYSAAGADMNVKFSPAGLDRATSGVGAILAEAQSSEQRARVAQAAATRQEKPIFKMLQDGVASDPIVEARWMREQQAAADGGDMQAAMALHQYRDLKQRAPYIEEAYKVAPAQLEAEIARGDSAIRTGTATPQQYMRLQAFKDVRDEIVKLRNTNPIALGERARLYRPVQIDPSADPDSPTFRDSLAQRGVQAAFNAGNYLGSAAALKPEEALALKERYDSGNADDRFKLVQALAATLPERAYSDTLKQIAGTDGGTQFVGFLARTRPELAREIFKGMALANTEGVKNKMTDVRSAFANKLGGQVFVSEEQQGAVVDAALALYTARRSASGNLYDPTTDGGAIGKALDDVAGPIVKRNGSRVAAPPGMTAGQFTGALDGMDQATIDRFGGAYDRSGKPFDAAFIASHAQLKQLQPGGSRYVVLLPGADGRGVPVLQAPDPNVGQAPLVIDMAQVAKRPAGAVNPFGTGVPLFGALYP